MSYQFKNLENLNIWDLKELKKYIDNKDEYIFRNQLTGGNYSHEESIKLIHCLLCYMPNWIRTNGRCDKTCEYYFNIEED